MRHFIATKERSMTASGTEDTPVLDTLAAMTLASVERSALSPDVLIMVRLAALAAVGAPAVSYLAHVGPALEAGVTLRDVQDVLVGVAPVIGSARTMAAGKAIGEAFDFAIAVVEAELD
jgi:alkylhydroperoxidase/carboxymuconolactone decarboxylase family protein YurZ